MCDGSASGWMVSGSVDAVEGCAVESEESGGFADTYFSLGAGQRILDAWRKVGFGGDEAFTFPAESTQLLPDVTCVRCHSPGSPSDGRRKPLPSMRVTHVSRAAVSHTL